jgi:hypothetical protein
MIRALYACASVLAIFTAGASTLITFDPPALPGGAKVIPSWNQAGYVFTSAVLASADSVSGNPLSPWDGSAYLETSPLTVYQMDHDPFNILAVDLAEYSTVYAMPMNVTFLGTHQDGSTDIATFTLDGVIDGNGPLSDFQYFQLSPSFTDMTSVTISGSAPGYPLLEFSIDNLVIDVPEPSAFRFAFLALPFSVAARRRRKNGRR